MAAARHKSVSAHIGHQEADFISEGNRTLALLESNNPTVAREFVHEKNSKQNLPVERVQPFASSTVLESSSQDTSLGSSFLESQHDGNTTSAYEDHQAFDAHTTRTEEDSYELMNKCPDTADHDDYSITLDREEMPLYGCFTRDSCHNTEPMNTHQEYDALKESMSTGNAKTTDLKRRE